MAGFFDNIKNKIQEWKQNAKDANNAPEQQPTEEDLIADAEINRRIEKHQNKSDELDILAYMSKVNGLSQVMSHGKKYLYFFLNEDYCDDEDYVDLAKWIFSHNGIPMEKHTSHVDGMEQFVLRMPSEEIVKYESTIKEISLHMNKIHSFQYGSAMLHDANGKMTRVKFPRQSYDRAVAKLKLKMDAEKTQKVKNQPDLSR